MLANRNTNRVAIIPVHLNLTSIYSKIIFVSKLRSFNLFRMKVWKRNWFSVIHSFELKKSIDWTDEKMIWTWLKKEMLLKVFFQNSSSWCTINFILLAVNINTWGLGIFLSLFKVRRRTTSTRVTTGILDIWTSVLKC